MRRKFIILLLSIILVQGTYGQWLSGYSYRQKIVNPDTSVSGPVTLIDFPLLVSQTEPNFNGEQDASGNYPFGTT